MMRVTFLFLLIIYYWYFYASRSKSVKKPSSGSPGDAPLYQCKFESNRSDHFQFTVNGKVVWEHALSEGNFEFHKEKIVRVDACRGRPDGLLIPAVGQTLYDFLNLNPEIKNLSGFKENSEFTVRNGNVFYFKCLGGHIDQLQICPSGTTLIDSACHDVNRCTERPDGTLFPHSIHASKYVSCQRGKEIVRTCPPDQMFHHDRCESIGDLVHYCKNFPKSSFLFDDETRGECRDGKLVFVRCRPGRKFIDDRCQFSICVGKPDGERIPLPSRTAPPFNFVPGYLTCKDDKIDEVVECPQHWDESLSRGDDLTSLPMVFDGEKCSVPTFCENVFSDDPDVVVPLHDFTKRVKNWHFSKFLDRSAGYACDGGNVRKRKRIEPGKIISKRFRAEPACAPDMPTRLPVYDSPDSFYDCLSNLWMHCQPSHFFNGSHCVPEPTHAFRHGNVPLFQFDSLNFENWIKPWDYSKNPTPTCRDPESVYVELYNVCAHPDCAHLAFLSQIPDASIALPNVHRARCKFHYAERTLKKEPFDLRCDFWTQKILTEEETESEDCVPGDPLRTGNFIWDSTIFSTCDVGRPFVFCPSSKGDGIFLADGREWACRPPSEESYVFDEADWTHFETNEIKRVLPASASNLAKYVRINKSRREESIPEEGIEIPEGEKINLLALQPVRLEPRYRVTHPPNVAFLYDGETRVQTHPPEFGFLIKLKNFTHKPLTFPTYAPIHLVESLKN